MGLIESLPTSRVRQVSVFVSRTQLPFHAVPLEPNVLSFEILRVYRNQLVSPSPVSPQPCHLVSYLVFATSLYAYANHLEPCRSAVWVLVQTHVDVTSRI